MSLENKDKLISFDKNDYAIIRKYALDIKLTNNESFICKPFRQGLDMEIKMKELLDQMEEKGILIK